MKYLKTVFAIIWMRVQATAWHIRLRLRVGGDMKDFLIVLIFTIIIFFIIALSGCTTVRYNPETHEVFFQTPVFDRSIDKLSITKLENGDVLIEIENYATEGMAPVVAAAVRAALDAK